MNLPILKNYFASQPDVTSAYLFGSHARGQAGPLSDVDIAVLLHDACDATTWFDRRLHIMGDLTALLCRHEVDIAILNQTPLALSYRVLRDGILLYEHDHDARVLFKARTISAYLDFKPILERYEHALVERARTGELLHGHNPYRGSLERHRRLRERLKGTTKPHV